jgi:enhancer of polycomb-like protein
MAKGSGRFRNRKLGFKSRIAVRVGVVDFEEDPLLEGELEFEDEKDGKGVDTGVDKEEEGEVHLQAVIASSTASVSRTTTGAGASSSSSSSSSKPVAKAFIPTPDSAGTIDDATFSQLYPKGYTDPITYIRFSDTVEDATIGAVEYTMDEDDEDWLEAYNASFAPGAKPRGAAAVEDNSANGRAARDRKGKGEKARTEKGDEKGGEVGPISEDDFERVMELFEKVTDQKAPMAHVVSSSSLVRSRFRAEYSLCSLPPQDVSLLPSLTDMESGFTDIVNPSLASLKIFACSIYPHWKERRLKRAGKNIIPQLDVRLSSFRSPAHDGR